MKDALPEAPPEFFNIAEYLIGINTPRASKPAFIDDTGSITYGEHR